MFRYMHTRYAATAALNLYILHQDTLAGYRAKCVSFSSL